MVGLADFVRDADFAVGVEPRFHGTLLLVLSCFDKSRFIQAKAARWLGVSRLTMKAKLVHFGLHPGQDQERAH